MHACAPSAVHWNLVARLAPILLLLGLALLVEQAEATDSVAAANVREGEASVCQEDAALACMLFELYCHDDDAQGPEDWNVPQGHRGECLVRVGDFSAILDPPNGDHANDNCQFDLLWDNSAVLVRNLFTADTCPTVQNPNTPVFLTNFWPTADGTETGAPRAGTVRMRIRVTDATAAGTPIYDLNSDDRNALEVAGALRFGIDVSLFAHNGYLAGATHAYTVAGEAMGFTMTHTAPDGNQGSRNARFSTVASGATCAASTIIESSTTALETDGTTARTYTVTDTYPAQASNIGLRVDQLGDATLTGADFTFLQGAFACGGVGSANHDRVVRADFVALDPRIRAIHLLNLNDNTFGAPPTSEDDCCVRLTSDLAFFATRLVNARDEGLVGATVQLTHRVADVAGLGVPDQCAAQGIGSQGGEAGWTVFCTWDETLPVGVWRKTADVSAPSSIDSNAHLVNDQIEYTLNAQNPDFIPTVTYELNQRDGLSIRFFVSTISEGTLVSLDDTPPPSFIVTQMESGTVEYLDLAQSWQPFSGSADRREFTTPGGAIWEYSFPAADVRNWAEGDFTITAAGYGGGAPTGAMVQVSNVEKNLETMALEVETAFDAWVPPWAAFLGWIAYVAAIWFVRDPKIRFVMLFPGFFGLVLLPMEESMTEAMLVAQTLLAIVIAIDSRNPSKRGARFARR